MAGVTTVRSWRRAIPAVLVLVTSFVAAPAHGATTDPASAPPTQGPVPVKKFLANERSPELRGTAEVGSTMLATKGAWSSSGLQIDYQWFSDGVEIPGATSMFLQLDAREIGSTVNAEITASRPGYVTVTRATTAVDVERDLPKVRETVQYEIAFVGRTTEKKEFAEQVQRTLDDPRGWRADGIAFERVDSGGELEIVLSQASRIPGYSPACSSSYSCRVGRFVLLNQDNWTDATKAWRKGDASVRDYRHMLVNHEVGHWLGREHVTCDGGSDQLAPVMQQQSKTLAGCAANPWPLRAELGVPRFSS